MYNFSQVHNNARGAYFLASRAALMASCSSSVFSVELSVDMYRCAIAGMKNLACTTIAVLLLLARIGTANAAVTTGKRRSTTADNSVATMIQQLMFEMKSRFTMRQRTEHSLNANQTSADDGWMETFRDFVALMDFLSWNQ